MSEATTIVVQAEPIRMNRADAAKFLGISPRKLQRLNNGGQIRHVTDPGGVRMYPTEELRRYLKRLQQEQWGEVA